MADRIAIKRLTQSDLTFIDYHFQMKTFGESKQKAINLNRNVLIDRLFPDLARSPEARINVLLTVYGPAGAGAFTPSIPTRPILNNNAKNWRLNGRTLPDDPSLPNRFKNLGPDDLAVMVFRGWPRPNEIDLTFISAQDDVAVHRELDKQVGHGRKSMVQVTRDALQIALRDFNLEDDHPLITLIEEEPPEDVKRAIDDVIHGGAGSEILRRRRGGPRLTPAELAEARNSASRVGEEGEEILHAWLLLEQESGRISNVEWVSRRDAAAPYDFLFLEGTKTIRMDAKSTGGPFERRIHVSHNELIEAKQQGSYRIARVFNLSEDGALCRICQEFGPVSKGIIDGLKLPAGTVPNGFSILPETMEFGSEFELQWPLDE